MYRGTALEAASAWGAEHPGELGSLQKEFLDTSESLRRSEAAVAEAERIRRRRVRRIATSALALLTVTAVVATAIASVALRRSRTEESAAKERLANLLGTQALSESQRDPLLALALATESIARSDSPPVDAERALFASRAELAGSRGPVPAGAPFPVGDARTLTATPDGSMVATGSRTGQVDLWDPVSGVRRGSLTAPRNGIQDLAVDPSGQVLMASDGNGRIWRWDLRTPDRPPTTPFVDVAAEGRNNVIWAVAFSPDGRTLGVATEFTGVLIVDAITGEKRTATGTAGLSDFLSVAFSPDGTRLLAGTGVGDLITLAVPSGERIGQINAVHPSNDVWEVAFDPGGKNVVTGSSDGTARTWRADTMQPVAAAMSVPGEELKGVVISADGRFVHAGATDGTVRTFELGTSVEIAATQVGHTEEVIAAAASADGRVMMTLGDDEQVRLWRVQAHPAIGTVRGDLHRPAAGIAIDAAGTRLAVSDAEGDVHVLDVGPGATRAAPLRLPRHVGRVFGMAYVSSGALVTGDDAGTLRRFSPGSAEVGTTHQHAHAGRIMGVAASPDGDLVATVGSDGRARLWNADDLSPHGKAMDTAAAGGGDVTFTPSGDRVVVASGRWVTVWSTDGDRLNGFEAGSDVIWGVAVSPDGSLVATASADRTVAVWALAEPDVAQHRLGHSGVATDVVFSADADSLITTSRDGEVRYWDRRSGQLLGQPYADTDAIGEVWRAAYDPARSRLWFAGQDGAVRAVDALDRRLACDLAGTVLDPRHRQRFLGGQQAIGCSRPAS